MTLAQCPSDPGDGRINRPACAVGILRAAGQEFPGLFCDLMLEYCGVHLGAGVLKS